MATNNATNTSNPISVPQGGTGAATLTGVLTGNGTSAVTASTITQHDILVGGASNAITSVAPSATVGQPFLSTGASTNPAFGAALVVNSATLPATSSSSVGVINLGGNPLIHSYGDSSNIYIGGAGNFTASASTANVGIGPSVLSSMNASGASSNVAIGQFSLSQLINGYNNVAIGVGAGSNYASGEANNLCIYNSGVATESNTVRLGTQGSGNAQQNKCFIAGITGATVTGAAVLCATNGQLGTVVSSQRYKENIQSPKKSILELTPVQFTYKEDKNQLTSYGMIAEEVHEKFHELCLYDDQGRPESIKYHEMTALLLMEIQKLNDRIKNLEGAE